MTRDEVIRMAREVSLNFATRSYEEDLQNFAALVVAAERKACEEIAKKELDNTLLLTTLPPKSGAAWNIAAAIRARGET